MIKVYNNVDHASAAALGCVVAIGNFDGVHLGHRALVLEAARLARRENCSTGVLTFEPHPRQFFQPEAEPFRLTLLSMKQRLLGECGATHLFSFSFDKEFSSLSAHDFIDKILVNGLKARHVVVGEDFVFGHGRSGTVRTLEAVSGAGAFGLTVVNPVLAPEGQVYSSTAIRQALREGDIPSANTLLGWLWQMESVVVTGDKRGRTLGFPTANQNVTDYVRIPYGVYAVRVNIEGESFWRDGVANFGIRPMFKVAQPLFETFIFDFDQEIYGKIMRVQPVQHLRSEMSFTSVEALVSQMKDDCIAAKAVLKSA